MPLVLPNILSVGYAVGGILALALVYFVVFVRIYSLRT